MEINHSKNGKWKVKGKKLEIKRSIWEGSENKKNKKFTRFGWFLQFRLLYMCFSRHWTFQAPSFPSLLLLSLSLSVSLNCDGAAGILSLILLFEGHLTLPRLFIIFLCSSAGMLLLPFGFYHCISNVHVQAWGSHLGFWFSSILQAICVVFF